MTEQILTSSQRLLHGLHGERNEVVGLAVSQLKTQLAEARGVLAQQDSAETLDQLIKQRDRLMADVERLDRLRAGTAG